MTEPLTPVVRPDGGVYRPRKAPYALLTGYDDDIEGVMVMRTHDLQRAEKIARRALDAYDTDGKLYAPTLEWGHWRPDRGTDALAWERSEDGSTGTPAVWFSVKWS